jgi:hypothetical protein
MSLDNEIDEAVKAVKPEAGWCAPVFVHDNRILRTVVSWIYTRGFVIVAREASPKIDGPRPPVATETETESGGF